MTMQLALQKSTIVRPLISPPVTPVPIIRPLGPEDVPLIEAMSPALSARSLYQRFFTGTPTIPSGLLALLATIDHDAHEAVAAVVDGSVIGFAHYVRAPGQTGAELAVLVVDAWQHRGIGRRLVAALAELARAHGLTRFEATVLRDNLPARRAVASLWPMAVGHPDEDGIDFELPLTGTRPRLSVASATVINGSGRAPITGPAVCR